MVAIYAFSHVLAGFIAAVITERTSKIHGDDSWKIPIAIMFAFPGLALSLAWLLPESPRWLLRKGRFEQAVESLYYIHGADKDYPAEQEALLIRDMMDNAPTKGSWGELLQGTNKVSKRPRRVASDRERGIPTDHASSAAPWAAWWRPARTS